MSVDRGLGPLVLPPAECMPRDQALLTFCWRHSLQARLTGCLLLSSRESSSISSTLPGELSMPAMVTLRLRPCMSEADMATDA
jgi:hypothetical protein